MFGNYEDVTSRVMGDPVWNGSENPLRDSSIPLVPDDDHLRPDFACQSDERGPEGSLAHTTVRETFTPMPSRRSELEGGRFRRGSRTLRRV